MSPVIFRVEELLRAALQRRTITASQLAMFVQNDCQIPFAAWGFVNAHTLDLAAIGADSVRQIWSDLPPRPSTRTLVFTDNGLGHEGLMIVCKRLAEWSGVEHLHIGNNHSSEHTIAQVLDGLAAGREKLKSLWCGHSDLTHRSISCLVSHWSSLKSLATVDLFGNRICTPAIETLLEAVEPSTLTSLLIDGQDIHDRDVDAIANRLRKCRSLRAISMGAHQLSDQSIAKICDAVAALPSLEVLSLRSVGLSDRGACSLAELVRAHRRLAALDLSFFTVELIAGVWPNNVGAAGSRALAQACAESRSIRQLNLAGNAIDSAQKEQWLTVYQDSSTLDVLTLDPSPDPDIDQRFVSAFIRKRNHKSSAGREAIISDELNQTTRVLQLCARKWPTTLQANRVTNAHHQTSVEYSPVLAALLDAVGRAERGEPATDRDLVLRGLLGRWQRALTPRRAKRGAKESGAVRRARARDSAMQAHVRAAKRRAEHEGRPQAAESRPDPELEKVVQRTANLRYEIARRCYICRQFYSEIDSQYDQLCLECAQFNRWQRDRPVALDGLTALVTGARVRIGYATVLRLLRAGARVFGTSRFCNDAMCRYLAEPDAHKWIDRLRLLPIDLRWINDIPGFCADLVRASPVIDIVVNNAAQTIAHGREFYAALLEREQAAAAQLSAEFRQPIVALTDSSQHLAADAARTMVALDSEQLPVDLQSKNSWRARINDVSLGELVSVHAINSLAPYALIAGLHDALAEAAKRNGDAFVVNVTSVEGQFAEHNKSDRHPHTNMAKAALNMLTRTASTQLSRSRIWMNSVDPGWISAQNPAASAAASTVRGWMPPLQLDDAAARVLAPVADRRDGQHPVHGILLKHYRPAPW